ncbi:MAG: lysophospholipid acyltransferase family protein [Acidimicrobiia bacterium]
MPDNPILRRLVTVPTAFLLFLVITGLSPLLLLLASAIDLFRSLTRDRPWMAVRSLAFLWVYLLGQMWALLGLLFSAPVPKESKLRITFDLQSAWTGWNLAALRRIFSLDLVVEGQGSARNGPIVLLCRHASIVDTMLPAGLVARPFRIRLRYVLKRELLIDPTLDIGGNRLPNYFVDRASGDSAAELGAIRELARDLDDDEGVLIYPEGTRFSEEKREVYTGRLAREPGVVGQVSARLRRVLPPRPGGTLAILDASTADVVILAHHGLEGLATVRDIWEGGLVGSRIRVRLWRIPRESIPTGRSERVDWLFSVWAAVDEWVVAQSEGDG